MATKKTRKPDQEIYRPPRTEHYEKSHERTFYNSNHKKKTSRKGYEEQNIHTDSANNKKYALDYEKFEANFSKTDNYQRNKYNDDNRYKNYKNSYYDPYDYGNKNRRYEYENYRKPNYQVKHSENYYQFSDNSKYKPQYPKKKGDSQSQKSIESAKSEKLEYHRDNYGKSPVVQNVNPSTERVRTNSYNKDFNDSRLFNPYKDESEMHIAKPDNLAKDRSKEKEIDSHIHGGLIHLPGSVAISNSANSVSTTTGVTSSEQKPTVMVRPTFSQLSTTMPYTTVPAPAIIHGVPTIPAGFIPVTPTFISPATINYIRQPPPAATNVSQVAQHQPFSAAFSEFNPLISPGHFSPHIIASTPDDTTYNLLNMNKISPVITQSVNKIRSLEPQLAAFIESGHHDLASSDWWNSLNSIRMELMNAYRLIIMNDLDFCNQNNIEQSLWKFTFYSVMELFRTYFMNRTHQTAMKPNDINKTRELVQSRAHKMIQEGNDYFTQLYTDVSKLHNVDLEVIFNSKRPPPETGSRTRKLVYLSAQKLLLFLGDMARYLEIVNGTSDYSQARIWYLKAQLLVPKNGRPYNQLAVISIQSNRMLDGLYYYTRTLAASNPFPTASQCLTFLFEDARRKGDELHKRQQESLKRKRKKQLVGNNDNRRKGCIEIWIHPENGMKEKKVTDDDDTDVLATFDSPEEERTKAERQIREDYSSLPLIELNKMFVLSFLNSHGKLFGKINMENFPEVCSTMLQELNALLGHQPCPLSSYRLCHMLIINMFIMDYVSGNVGNTTGNLTLRSLHQDHTSRMTLDFFALLCQRALELFLEWEELQTWPCNSQLQLPSDLSSLLAPICLWTDWMVTHPEYWNPPPSHRDPMLPPNIHDCDIIAQLCTVVSRVCENMRSNIPRFRIVPDIKEAEKLINNRDTFILLEENLICGFLPMLDQIPKMYVMEDEMWTKEQIEDWIHLEKLSLFGDFLSGINPPLLDYNVETQTFVSAVIKESSERRQDDLGKELGSGEYSKEYSDEIGSVLSNELEDLDLKLKQEIDEINFTHGCNAKREESAVTSWADITEQAEEEERLHQQKIAQLKIRRANVKIREEKNRRYELWRQSLLDHEIAQRYVELEIRPLFLVLDTNCYIDYLPDICRLHMHGKFIIVVPLIVVNELENLSNTTQPKEDVNINARAKAALNFVEDKFERSDPNFKAITSRGCFMETIAYRSEKITVSEGETNDDVILNCCQLLCKDKPSEFMPRQKDRPITLHREVVLLTGDRNLRLKALSRHIPVKPLKKFMEWAGINKKKIYK